MKLSITKKIISLIIILCLAIAGCGEQKKQEPEAQLQSAENEQQSDKVPKQLQQIENNIEKIIKELNGPSVETDQKQDEEGKNDSNEENANSQNEKKNQDEGNKQDNQGENEKSKNDKEEQNEKSKDNAQTGQGDTQSNATSQPKPSLKKDPWTSITPVINELHYQWNTYMPIAAKKGASKTLMDNFSKALNSLTNTIITKNSINTMMAASYLYAYIPDFYSLYKTEVSPEIKRIRYYLRNSMLNSMAANWTQADYDINTLKSSWALFKNTIPKEQQDVSGQLDFSVYEFDKVVRERNQPLIDIKGRVALLNLGIMEEAMKKDEKEKSSQSKD